MTPTNPLSPRSILEHMAAALPTHAVDDPSSDISSSYEALALFAHACMVSLGFRLLGFSEDAKDEAACQRLAPRLPDGWRASFNSHTFVYAHTQSAMHFVIKLDRMGGRADIRGLAVGDERIHRFEVAARDYISAAALPVRISRQEEGGEEDRSDLEEKLGKVFISEERMTGESCLYLQLRCLSRAEC